MPECVHNLLTDPVFGVDSPRAGREFITLPDVMARLSAGDPLEFAALRPHQTHAWHAFLVQLGAIVLHQSRAGNQFPTDPERWREMLRGATGGGDEPWCLVVEDLSQPAFMQPPVPERSLAKWKNSTPCPDDIDLLVTARNHDVKSQQIVAPHSEHWAYALVSVQTMDGFGGKNNYGIARMNGGYGNRPCLAVAENSRWAVRFEREVNLALERRPDMIERYGYQSPRGHILLWLIPWNGKNSLSPQDCDPFFVEICRRIRLVADAGRVTARFTGTPAERVRSNESNGNLGDLWTPVRKADGAALTANNLSYNTVQQVIFGPDYEHSPASKFRPEDGKSPVLIAQVLVRGQGQTEGFHQRQIPVPAKARRLFATPDGVERLGKLSKERVEDAADITKKLLRPALLVLMQGGPEEIDYKDDRSKPFERSLDRKIDAIFFPRLFDSVDRDRDEAHLHWNTELIKLARIILHQAFTSVPIPAARRYRAIARAERLFESRAYKRLHDLETKGGDTNEHSTTTS